MTNYNHAGVVSTMVQLINISGSILYDLQKADNKFLGLINACISHEPKNPLNSLSAQVLEKTTWPSIAYVTNVQRRNIR